MTTGAVITLVVVIIGWLATAAWTIIKLYFTSSSLEARLREMEVEIDKTKQHFDSELNTHKKDTADQIARLNAKLDRMNETLIKTCSYVELLLDNKIKTNNGKP